MSVCEVCDREHPETIIHGYPLHSECAPRYWVKGAKEHDEFMRRVRQLGRARYEAWSRWKP